MTEKIITIFSIVFAVLCWLLIIKNAIGNKFANVKTVKAEVIDKYKSNIVSNYPDALKKERHVVVFKTKDKKISFEISAFSYNGYRISEKGTLKYKGNRIISFK